MAEKKTKTKIKTKTSKTKKKSAARLTIPTPEQLLDAGVHFGHLKRRWHPKMEPYIYAEKSGIHVFDLYKTQPLLKKAAQFLRDAAANGKAVLFVGTKRQAQKTVRGEAERIGAFFITERWLGGLFTNFGSVKKNIEKLEELEQKVKDKEFDHYTKKEQLMIEREIDKLDRQVGGLRGMKELPGVLVLASARGDDIAAREARHKDIPVVAIVDTNTDPDLLDYIIPGNDDSASSVEIIIKTLAEAVELGRKSISNGDNH